MKSPNYFDLPEPQMFKCMLWWMEDDVLKLQVFRIDGDRWIVTFHGVLYVEIVSSWDGAAFYLASDEQCLTLARSLRTPQVQEMSDPEILSTYKVFLVDREAGFIQILARDAEIQPQRRKADA